METREITVRVTPEAARIYEAASEQDRRKIDLLLSLQISGIAQPPRPLEQVMREASAEAQARGLTPEILNDLLDER